MQPVGSGIHALFKLHREAFLIPTPDVFLDLVNPVERRTERLERRAALGERLAEGALILEGSRLRPTLEGLLIAERLAIELS